ncbi:MAG: 5-(carboxyamino)imidazole ribonucleotide synthase [Leptospiraceae bacterium]|nr:5-(carboxyamino)imidazole ribonucleotide synthase [Leptospiraceae bacterium]MCP5500052.1 5-(carboxyamino)imidazole ribonucleotide synthase [Leptospiraceae bacterium]
MILPAARLGLMGSGQLGRMFTQVAEQNGYRVACYSPETNSPASKMGAREYVASYEDEKSLSIFLSEIDALTFEFENIPKTALNLIKKFRDKGLRVCPSPEAIEIAQDRSREKAFFNEHGMPTTAFYPIRGIEDFYEIIDKIQYPVIIKVNQFGYDGKGQKKIHNVEEAEEWIRSMKGSSLIIEEVVEFEKELSIIIAGFEGGEIYYYLPSENIHKNHILDFTINPAKISNSIQRQCVEYSTKLIHSLHYVGVLGLEFFLSGEEVLCNEFAPRPHNSGHFTQDACNLSQFDLQLRALCNLPMPEELVSRPCIMKNIMGEDMETLPKAMQNYFQTTGYSLHLYGKEEARKGRKMGHWNYTGKLNYREAFPY